MKLIRSLSIPIVLLLAAGAVGCRKPSSKAAEQPKEVGKTAAQLLNEGEANLKRRKWEDGRKLLRMVEEYFPASPEFAKAKILMADSFFFGGTTSYPEALVEYQSFLNYFPRHELREYALFRIGLCHYASIENAERDQIQTRKAIEAFQSFLAEAPGSAYAVDARAKITQCHRRLAECELMVGIFYVNNMGYASAERRLKDLLEQYPEYVDRERAYYYLGEALRSKLPSMAQYQEFSKAWLEKLGLDEASELDKKQRRALLNAQNEFKDVESAKFRQEARTYYQRLVESYPNSAWTGRAKDRLIEMGQSNVKQELDG